MTVWKVLLGLGLALPPAAYVAGSLASPADEPTPRTAIVLPTTPPSGSGSGIPSPTPAPGSERCPEDDRDDRDDGDDRDDRDLRDDDVVVVVPCPQDVDDDEGDDRGDNDNARRGTGNADDDGPDDDGHDEDRGYEDRGDDDQGDDDQGDDDTDDAGDD